jgi:hypothetical protein
MSRGEATRMAWQDKAVLVRFVKWASMQGRNYIDRVDVPPVVPQNVVRREI